MDLTPTEQDRLQIFLAAELARRVLLRGLTLNAPEATALICDEMHLAARTGATYEEVAAIGVAAVSNDQLINGVAELISEIRVEVLLDEGTRLFVIRRPS
jgi:urease subunit gamma/beta